jgi:3',5'-cyclic AMP phosphodiesterase CpdA
MMATDKDRRAPTRRQLIGGLLAAGGLAGCGRFDATTWVIRERYDVDYRFRESVNAIDAPLPPRLDDRSRWSALLISDAHFWEDEYNRNLLEIGEYLERSPVDLVFQLGDIADAGYYGEYRTAIEMLEAFDVAYYGCLGNHDIFHEGWSFYRDFFGPSVYSLRLGDVQIIVLDQASGTLGGLQRGWLEEQLERSNAARVVVLGHYPLWSPTDGGFSQMGSEQEVYDILDLLRRRGVYAHISGHTHRYAYTEVNGTKLITLGSIKEGHANRCGLRIDADGDDLTLTRIELPLNEVEI